jgi:hypothetical protein
VWSELLLLPSKRVIESLAALEVRSINTRQERRLTDSGNQTNLLLLLFAKPSSETSWSTAAATNSR